MSGDRNASGQRQKSGQAGRGDKKRKRKAKSKPKQQVAFDPVAFWGDPELLPEPIASVSHSPDVTAAVSSLGRIPIPPHETAAQHSFQMVYQRASMLASALAAASDLNDVDEDESE